MFCAWHSRDLDLVSCGTKIMARQVFVVVCSCCFVFGFVFFFPNKKTQFILKSQCKLENASLTRMCLTEQATSEKLIKW